MFELKDQIAIVTGGAKGIGKGIVKTLIEAGAKVVIADIDEAAAEQTAAELGCAFKALDVTSQAQCKAVVDEVVSEYGRLDILCSNSGIFPQAYLADMTEADWDQMQNINLKGTFFVTQAALAYMKKQGYGRVVITASITGPITGYPGWSHYAASKAGQLGFMRSASLEYAKEGITINAVMPGNILTEGLAAHGEEYLGQMTRSIPARKLGKPEDIGYAVCFLASKEASYITGQTIIVDGGQILPESPEAIL
ncbi:3-oxoacyl-[acyl-carrier-protein] reductase FabG [Oligella urethralis]|uniref:3-oxoacyl-ACP reductase FabG n=1 Tax=Oligella urethralis TaxID=90245 RepID=UPI000E062454|nr:3-oxoacyl-ACP reductase FabG [Oligella urethralis]SUA65189.1 3-oxoacyl-[acyl-carrier-protein] reductase FabG [Oligella urethralis]